MDMLMLHLCNYLGFGGKKKQEAQLRITALEDMVRELSALLAKTIDHHSYDIVWKDEVPRALTRARGLLAGTKNPATEVRRIMEGKMSCKCKGCGSYLAHGYIGESAYEVEPCIKCISKATETANQRIIELEGRLRETEGWLRQFNTCLSLQDMTKLLRAVHKFLNSAPTTPAYFPPEGRSANSAEFVNPTTPATEPFCEDGSMYKAWVNPLPSTEPDMLMEDAKIMVKNTQKKEEIT